MLFIDGGDNPELGKIDSLTVNEEDGEMLGAELVVLVGRFDRLGKAVGGLLSSSISTLCSREGLVISDRF
jgi:hypothetical protein